MAEPSIARSESPTLYSTAPTIVLPSSQNLPADAQAIDAVSSAPPPAPTAPDQLHTITPAALASSIQDDAYSYTADPARANEVAPADRIPVVAPALVTTPKLSITLLLVSGRRRTIEFEPSTVIRELKETVWGSWPADWTDELPPSPAFLRILYLGRILTDETTLASLNLPEPPESTVVHVSVRSFAPTSSDEDLKKKPKRRGTRRGRGIGADAADGGENGGVAGDGRGGAGIEAEDEGAGGCCGCIIC